MGWAARSSPPFLFGEPQTDSCVFHDMALNTERQKCAHLLRRFGLGASEAELDFYLKDGLDGAISLLLNYDATPEGFDLDPEAMANQQGNLQPQFISVWWTARLMVTARPLQEKMTLFWHDHFATSGSKVTGGRLMAGQNEVLRANATGNFRTLLREVSKDPAMLFWLDNQYNVKGKPNENFAREVMELFTLGIGNYTEKDIQEGARAFTGWSLGATNRRVGEVNDKNIKRGSAGFQFRPLLHDNGEKQFLGKTGPLTGDDVIDTLCDMPRTAWYITWKLWNWFAYETDKDPVIDRLADKFHKSNLNIKLLLQGIMKSPEFYSEKAERKIYKNPVDFVIATSRQIGLGQYVAQQLAITDNQGPRRAGPAALARQKLKSMGMDLLFPPDVAGWDGGQNWVTSATMVERINWARLLFGRDGRSVRYPVYGLISSDPTPRGLANKLISVFDAPLPPEKVALLVQAASKASQGQITPQNAADVAVVVAEMIFASPEFQFA